MLHGSINHVSLTVADLPAALAFFDPLLRFLGYTPEHAEPTSVQVFLSCATDRAVNIWQASPNLRDHLFEDYAPGLRHLAFNVQARDNIDTLEERIPEWGGVILNPPADYGYTNVGSYYAAYFSGLKFECVHMSELEKQYDRAQLLQRKLWPHPTG